MNEFEATEKMNNAVAGQMSGGLMPQGRRLYITLRQNIDERIKQAQAQVAELEATKNRMEASGILDMRIDDIRRAMQF